MARRTNAKLAAPLLPEGVADVTPIVEVVKTASATKLSEIDLSDCGTNKAAMIRKLNAAGGTRSEIVKEMEARGFKVIYQYVRNILVQPAPQAKVADGDSNSNNINMAEVVEADTDADAE